MEIGRFISVSRNFTIKKRENEKKGFTLKWMRQRGFYACSADFVTKNFHLFTMPHIIIPICQFSFYYLRERKAENEKVEFSQIG